MLELIGISLIFRINIFLANEDEIYLIYIFVT